MPDRAEVAVNRFHRVGASISRAAMTAVTGKPHGARIWSGQEQGAKIISHSMPTLRATLATGEPHAMRLIHNVLTAAIASLLFDALRKSASAAFVMGADAPRAIMLGALREARGLDASAIAALCSGEGHAPAPLSDEERARLETATLDAAPDHVRGDYPEWLADKFALAFGDRAAEEGAALATRAPVDLRVNILKGDRAQALAKLAHLAPAPTPLSPLGLRIDEIGRAHV